MAVMLERWNDGKMDALAAEVTGLAAKVGVLDAKVDGLGTRMEKGFERVDVELREQRREMLELGREMKAGFERVDERLERTHRLMVVGVIALSSAYTAGFAALVGLIATQV